MYYTVLLWGYVESNTSQLTNMDRNESISPSVLMMVNLVVTFHEMVLHEDRLGLDLQLWRNWVFFAQVGTTGKTNSGNLYFIAH